MLYYTNAASETVVRHIVGNACKKKNRDPHREIPTPYLSKALRKP